MTQTRHRFTLLARLLALPLLSLAPAARGDAPPGPSPAWDQLAPSFSPPREYVEQFGPYRSPLLFDDGSPVKSAADWPRRREQILAHWHGVMGQWPPVIDKPKVEVLEVKQGEGLTRRKVRVEIAPGQTAGGYLLVPPGPGPFPAVFVPFYEPETSAGLIDTPEARLRAFAYQLARRGFVTLSIGSPGGDARKPDTRQDPAAARPLQPLSFLAYVAANCYNALASLPEVDAKRVGVVGHSYGGKWALFAGCLWDKYAAAAWSDPGVVWDEQRPNVNYWEPWYLGLGPPPNRKPGVITADNPRTGAYKVLIEEGRRPDRIARLDGPAPLPRVRRVGGSAFAVGGAEPRGGGEQAAGVRGTRRPDQPQGRTPRRRSRTRRSPCSSSTS